LKSIKEKKVVCLTGLVIIALSLVVVAPAVATDAPPLAFKGVRIGATQAEMDADKRASRCPGKPLIPGGACYALTSQSIGDATGLMLVNLFNGRVGSILFGFDADKFETVSRAFTDKYGPATKTATQTKQNRAVKDLE
jgi:hypothetical protein